MTFTIITATYNSEKTIARSLDSLLNQTLLDFEYIIIDGNSKDGTLNILKSYESKFKEKGLTFAWFSEPDSGIYDAWNKGLKYAKGDWISFLGSDDYYLNDALENYFKLLSISDKPLDWIYSNVLFVKGENNKRLLNSVWSWKDFRRNIKITPAHVGSFHNKLFFKTYGVYDTTYKIAGDYEILLRPKSHLKTAKIEITTAIMDGGGVSNNMIKKVFGETLRAKRETGGVSLFLCYFDYYMSLLKFKIKSILNR
ncbi:glycosyltransferase family 2 protein [Psychroserpens sp. Hel_I_66]|uniref:glycosyltransferase family 2 protein n=1 Tax=Psychroserpens sp. Hel_I_66 TaxID=1250004 RepID=UPI0006470505|nr:glycosyltransferase family 2 protein [Psychroserpens sp. Hel_I_66]